MHFEIGNANEETRAPELLVLFMITKHVTDVLAEEAFNTFAKLLYAIYLTLIHLPFDVWTRRERRNSFVDTIVPRNVGDQVLKHRKCFHGLNGDGLVEWERIQTSFAG